MVKQISNFILKEYLENTQVLYLPVCDFEKSIYTLRPELDVLKPLIYSALDNHKGRHRYLYLSVNKDFYNIGDTQKRPGWHVDGYKTDDENYIWSDREPTEYIELEYLDTELSHEKSLEYFKDLAKGKNIKRLKSNTLYMLGKFIHRTPTIRSPGVRTFVKLSFSNHRYNLVGNAVNKINKNWKFYDREVVRNCPVHKNFDYYKEDL